LPMRFKSAEIMLCATIVLTLLAIAAILSGRWPRLPLTASMVALLWLVALSFKSREVGSAVMRVAFASCLFSLSAAAVLYALGLADVGSAHMAVLAALLYLMALSGWEERSTPTRR